MAWFLVVQIPMGRRALLLDTFYTIFQKYLQVYLHLKLFRKLLWDQSKWNQPTVSFGEKMLWSFENYSLNKVFNCWDFYMKVHDVCFLSLKNVMHKHCMRPKLIVVTGLFLIHFFKVSLWHKIIVICYIHMKLQLSCVHYKENLVGF